MDLNEVKKINMGIKLQISKRKGIAVLNLRCTVKPV